MHGSCRGHLLHRQRGLAPWWVDPTYGRPAGGTGLPRPIALHSANATLERYLTNRPTGGALIRPVRGLRLIFGTSRGLRMFAASLLAAFGLMSAAVQFFGQLFPSTITEPGLVTLSAFFLCLLWGIARTYPRQRFQREFGQPEVIISVAAADLFDQDAHIVVGFTDTFDTSVRGGRIISAASVQGQLIERRYGGDQHRLDRALRHALAATPPTIVESRRDKPLGKLKRYPIGTVAVLGGLPRLIFAVAYSSMENDLLARSSVNDLWISLNSLWDAIYERAQHERVAIPLLGSALARIDPLERQNLFKMMLLSFLARSRQGVVCRELLIVIWPPDVDKMDMLEAEAFLRGL
jgi:Domain of unknown function (DUF6430)